MFNYRTNLGQAEFENPIFTASGCAGSGKELSQFFNLTELGAVVTKSIMLKYYWKMRSVEREKWNYEIIFNQKMENGGDRVGIISDYIPTMPEILAFVF